MRWSTRWVAGVSSRSPQRTNRPGRARARYAAVDTIVFEGVRYRNDIAAEADG